MTSLGFEHQAHQQLEAALLEQREAAGGLLQTARSRRIHSVNSAQPRRSSMPAIDSAAIAPLSIFCPCASTTPNTRTAWYVRHRPDSRELMRAHPRLYPPRTASCCRLSRRTWPRHDVHEGGLARAVGADHAQRFALARFGRHLAKRSHPAEALAQRVDTSSTFIRAAPCTRAFDHWPMRFRSGDSARIPRAVDAGGHQQA